MNNLDTDANAKAVDSLINFETVRYFTNEKYEVDRFSDVVRAYNGWQIRVVRSLSLLNVGQSFILAVSLMVVSFVVVFDVLAGKKTVGDFVMLNMYLLSTFSQLGFLGTIYRQIRQSLTDMEDLFSLLREGVEVRDAEDALDLELVKGEVLFDGVKFSYGGERVILEDFSLLLGGRKKLAVVGPSGSGKTTLSRLLLRFYDVGEGRVEIDGQDVRKVTQESLRSYVGIVPQDTVLFNGTIGENIGYGRIGASEEEILEAAERARLGELLKELPDGLETMVGERGLKLSGGEKQRVAIARILLRNPPIVIFDEATSSLDTDTERAIMESLSELAEGRTTLMIAHRLATVADADVIVVMDKGRIVEEGTHEILLSRGGLYAKMWEAQRGLEEMERKKEEMKDFVKVT
jgi:ATP-binding cassette subfamily B protein